MRVIDFFKNRRTKKERPIARTIIIRPPHYRFEIWSDHVDVFTKEKD